MALNDLMQGQPTLEQALRRAVRELRAAGIVDAGRDARLLLAAASGLSQTELVLRSGLGLDVAVLTRFALKIARRAKGEPVSRILGQREFYGRPFLVTPDTLDPRADSETLIEAALDIIAHEQWRQRPLRIIDVGTGTGCLLLTLLAELPLASGVGVDISAETLEVARANAVRLDLGTRASFSQEPLTDHCDRFDILVCNPPYIPSDDIALLASDVRDYDPRIALDGGIDGFDVYRHVAARLDRLVPAGWAIFEVGAGQAGQVAALMAEVAAAGTKPRVWRDLGGHERCVAAKLR